MWSPPSIRALRCFFFYCASDRHVTHTCLRDTCVVVLFASVYLLLLMCFCFLRVIFLCICVLCACERLICYMHVKCVFTICILNDMYLTVCFAFQCASEQSKHISQVTDQHIAHLFHWEKCQAEN